MKTTETKERHLCDTKDCDNWNLPNEPHCVTHRTLTDAIITKETNCPNLCVDCKKPCEMYKGWLKKYRQNSR